VTTIATTSPGAAKGGAELPYKSRWFGNGKTASSPSVPPPSPPTAAQALKAAAASAPVASGLGPTSGFGGGDDNVGDV
jgi:hypothetical protein